MEKKEDSVNVRAYKVVLVDGNVVYESKNSGFGVTSHSSVALMAKSVRYRIDHFFQQTHTVGVSIDFRPFHDIEIGRNRFPRYCLPLTESEATEFWESFNS